jgi:trk system potassium uptake protein TrkA
MRQSLRSALVVGLGRFGSAAAERLQEMGWDVVGVDLNPAVVNDMKNRLEHVLQLDASDEEALASLGVPDFDVCIVSRGESIESGLLLVLNLQHLEAKKIVAKAASAYHARILQRLGIEHTIFPERDAGVQLAEHLQAPHLAQWMPLSKERELAIIRVPKGRAECLLSTWRAVHRPSLKILARLSPEGQPLIVDQQVILHYGEILIVLGTHEDILALGG